MQIEYFMDIYMTANRGQGRKPIDGHVAMEVYPIRLTARMARIARRFGDGNLSAGIRQLINEKDGLVHLPDRHNC